MDKYLIVGLGNPGDEYAETRHNTGYMVLDAFAKASNIVFEDKRYGYVAKTSIKGRQLILLKPTTFMNLSGNAVRYWMNKENIDLERLLVVVDDVALPFCTLRLKPSGSNGGHNGLGNIQSVLGTDHYSRLRFGIGNDYPRGMQIEYVLGKYTDEDKAKMSPVIDTAGEIIRNFALCGIDETMNLFNKRHG
jgi:PTH1 family peptidyl-tRNA hydrolase